MLLDDMTFQKFGYHLTDIAAGSHKRVVCSCHQCKRLYETQRRYYEDGELCVSCTNRQNASSESARTWMNKRIQQCKELGISPKGLPLIVGDGATHNTLKQRHWRAANPERAAQLNREAMQRKRRTLVGKVTNRLRTAFRKYLHGKSGFSDLPYTPAELQAHILTKLEERQYLCPMCGVSLEEKFDIDHRIPLSSAKTVDEVIALFALSNLDVLCPPCNQYKKGKKHLAY